MPDGGRDGIATTRGIRCAAISIARRRAASFSAPRQRRHAGGGGLPGRNGRGRDGGTRSAPISVVLRHEEEGGCMPDEGRDGIATTRGIRCAANSIALRRAAIFAVLQLGQRQH